jgi:hypothetical protein
MHLRPTCSANVTPNPPAAIVSPNDTGEDRNINNNIITNTSNTNINNITNNITINHPLNVFNNNNQDTSNTTEIPINSRTQSVTHINLHNEANHKRQYLISQFFKKSRTPTHTPTLSSNPVFDTPNHTVIPKNIPQQNNVILDDSAQSPTNENENESNSNSIPITYQNDTIRQIQRRRKNYVQQQLIRKPIPNDYWGSSMDTNGLTAGRSMARWIEMVSTMKDTKCDIFGLAETNTNWQCKNIKTNINHIITKQFINRLQFYLPIDSTRIIRNVFYRVALYNHAQGIGKAGA